MIKGDVYSTMICFQKTTHLYIMRFSIVYTLLILLATSSGEFVLVPESDTAHFRLYLNEYVSDSSLQRSMKLTSAGAEDHSGVHTVGTLKPVVKLQGSSLGLVARIKDQHAIARTIRNIETCIVKTAELGVLFIKKGQWILDELECGRPIHLSETYYLVRSDNTIENQEVVPCEELGEIDVAWICENIHDLSVTVSDFTDKQILLTSATGAQALIDGEDSQRITVGCFSDGLNGPLVQEAALDLFSFSSYCSTVKSFSEDAIFEPLYIPDGFPSYSPSFPTEAHPIKFTALITKVEEQTDCTLIGPHYAVVFKRTAGSSPWYLYGLNCNGQHFDMFGSSIWSDLAGKIFSGSCSFTGITDSAMRAISEYVSSYCRDPIRPLQIGTPTSGSLMPRSSARLKEIIDSMELVDGVTRVSVSFTQGGFFIVTPEESYHLGGYYVEPLIPIADFSDLQLNVSLLIMYEPIVLAVSLVRMSMRIASQWGHLRFQGSTVASFSCSRVASQRRHERRKAISTLLEESVVSSMWIPWITMCSR